MDPAVPQLFAGQARHAPDTTAVADPGAGRRLTYRELEHRSRRLGLRLRSLGVGPEVRVGLLLRRCPEMLVAVLAVLRAGGAYVPLDPSYPRARLRFMARDADLAVVLTWGDDPRLAGELSGGAPVIDLSVTEAAPGREALDLPRRFLPESAAYVIFTSGSSGRPKGVVVPHRSLAWHARAARSFFGFSREDRVLQFASLSFDLSVLETLPVLACGATVVLRDGSTAASVDGFFARCRDDSVTVALPPTSFWHEMAAALAGGAALPASLRLVVFGTERASAERVNGWLRAVGPADRPRLVNGYGATETTVDATACELTGRAPKLRRVPIGRPLPGVEVRVVDGRLEPVAGGGEGELAVAGPGVARGYLGRPAATARVFVPQAGAERPGARLYRTGDRGRRHGGELEVVGRIDFQVKVRGFRVEPEEIEEALERHPAVGRAAVVLKEAGATASRLLAFVVPRPGARLADELDGIRAELRSRLPARLVPAAFVALEALPLTPSKKVDRRALSLMDAPELGRAPAGREAPRNAAEASLAEIWADVLGLERVGVHENFFDLGGDSILNLRIAARAHAAGLDVAPEEVFRHPTVAELAALARPARAAIRPGAEPPPTGLARPTPIQRWFFELDPEEPWHFNQSQLLELRRPVAVGVLRRAFAALVERHDALRLGAERAAGWRLSRTETGGAGPVVCTDLSRLPAKLAAAAFRRASNEVQASLDLGAGPLLRAALFVFARRPARRCPARRRPARLLIAVHHLAVDTVSWHVLLEELETLCRDLAAGRVPALAPRTTSYAAWSERVAEHAASLDPRRVLEPWEKRPEIPPLPRDLAGGDNLRAAVGTVRACLDAERTRLLLRRVPAAYRTRINDVLLTALARTITRWTGGRATVVELESHGREPPFEGVDLTRTVGWFTTSYPLVLELPDSGGEGEALKAVKEQLRAVPGNGFDFFALRFGGPETADVRRIRELARAGISFNYLGQLDALDTPAFRLLRDDSVRFSPRGRREHLIEIEGAVRSGRFETRWHYGRRFHRRATVERLAGDFLERLDDLISHCLLPGAGGVTPSDFPLAGLDAAELELAAGSARDVEDVYPLTPVQQGFLFHSLYAPESPVYFEQYDWSLSGDLDAGAFRGAWQALVDRHPVLRTGFAWQDLPHPVQVVRRRVELAWRQATCLLEADHEARVADDRRRGFDLGAAPLMRCLLARLGDGWRFVWSVHHLLVDGWSVGSLVEEVLELYGALRRGRPDGRESPRPFRDYVAWLAARDAGAAERFWRRELEGLVDPTPLAMAETAAPADSVYLPHGEHEQWLAAPDTARLEAFARRHRLTWATLMAGAWAVVLARTSGRRDVVFGTTLAERPRSLAGAETMVGPLIRTVPVRVCLGEAEPLKAWLERLRDRLVELRRRGHGSLADIRSWSAVATGRELFESILGFHNYPGGAAFGERRGAGIELSDLRYHSQTNYPLLVEGHLEEGRLRLRASYDALRFRATAVRRTLGRMRRVLEGFLADAEPRLGELSWLAAAESHQLVQEWGRGGRAAEPAAPSLDGLFRRRAALAPDSPALIFEADGGTPETTVTYAELGRRAFHLAARLRRRGAGPESRAGVFTESSVERIAAILGVLEAGGAFVPLEPGDPDERLAFMLDDAGVSVVLTEARLARRLRGLGYRGPLVQVAGATGRGERPPSEEGRGAGAAREACYVIYTSGSTGRPKGAVLPHGAIVNHLAWTQALCGLDDRDRALVRIPPTFDASVLETFLPLVHGARLVLARAADHADPRYLLELMDRHRVTTLVTLTSVMRMLAAEHEASAGGVRLYVRRVVCGGEPMSGRDLERFRAGFPAAVFFHHYGPTETAVGVTFERCDAPEPPRLAPIGRPGPEVDVFLSDRRARPVGHGLAGELHVGGVQLARGYLGRPGLTAERFVPRALAAHPGSRLYRTGDLARHRDDGALEFLGRVDHQVKIRGVRVELGEVESVLASHPAVRQVAVAPRESAGSGERRLVAFVSPAAERAEEPHVRRMLALYDDLFSRLPRRGGADFDAPAWKTSTGEPVAEDEIREWLAASLERLEALEPRRVLEIGCGSGLLLMRLADRAERVVGTDFSAEALVCLEERFRQRGWSHGTFLCRQADDFAGVEKGAFDTVIMNSVVQCLPGAPYLLRSLRGAVEAAAPGGTVYLGDVFSRPLLAAKWLATEVEHGGASLTLEELRQRLDWHRGRSEHLAVDPAFFLALRRELPRIRDVRIYLRSGRRRNELNRFAYDVTLHLDRTPGGPSPVAPGVGGPVWLAGREASDPERLRRRLEDNRRRRPHRLLGLRAVVDRRLWRESRLLELLAAKTPADGPVGDFRDAPEPASEGGVEPDDLVALCREADHEVEVCAHSSHPPGVGGRYDLILRPGGVAGAPPEIAPRPWSAYVLEPSSSADTGDLERELRDHVRRLLPEALRPSVYVVLDELPRLASGKVDRGALGRLSPGAGCPGPSSAAARNDVELALAEIWRELLDLEAGLGVDDNVFELGAHSLLATQAASRIRRRLCVEVPLRRIFEAPTVALLARAVEEASSAPDEEDLEARHVERWRKLAEVLYREEDRDAGAFDTAGWISSYTDLPIPVDEMREWAAGTAERLRALAPRRVLEIGCGTGLLLLAVAPRTDHYLGTDFSSAVLARLAARVRASGLGHVVLRRRSADDFAGVEPGSFDTVVLNSVAQYFPSIDYLRRVLRGAAEALAEDGRIFVGDVRNLCLHEVFCASVELHRVAAAGEDPAASELGERIHRRRRHDDELLVDPAFFFALRRELPRITRVRVLPKRGEARNEMTLFRYDVVLELDAAPPAAAEPEWWSWPSDVATLEPLRRLLERRPRRAVGVRGVPDSRLQREVDLLDTLAVSEGAACGGTPAEDGFAELALSLDDEVEPDTLRALGREHGYELEWAGPLFGQGGRFDLLWRPRGEPAAPASPGPERPWSSYGNDPSAARAPSPSVRARADGGRSAAPPVLRARARPFEIPLSFAQQRLWFLERLSPGLTAFNMFEGWRLEGELDRAALETAWREVVRRHEVLRTRFPSAGGRPRQEIEPYRAGMVTLPVVDLRRLDPGPRRREVRRLAHEHGAGTFDLARDGLLRLRLLVCGERRHVLLRALHHIASDGWSDSLLAREVSVLYAAARHGRPSPLPEPAVQYADFALWQRDWLAGQTLESHLAWWRARLAGLPPLDLPADRPRPPVRAFRGGARRLAFAPPLVAALSALAARRRASLFMVLLAAFTTLLERYTGQRDFGVGSPIAHRNHRELEDLVGFFVNSLVLRADLSGTPPFDRLLDRVRRSTLEAYAHQDLPFERLVEALRPERELGRHPLFQVVLGLLSSPLEMRLPGLELRPLLPDREPLTVDMEWHLWETGGGIEGYVVYDEALFDRVRVERAVRHFERLLEAVARDPEQPADGAWLSAAEVEEVRAGWTGGAAPAVAERFEDGSDDPVPSAASLRETEAALLAIWSELLEIDHVGSTDNFFELGGHSLLATRVVSRVRNLLGVELPLRSFFERPTVAQLAREIVGRRSFSERASGRSMPERVEPASALPHE